MTHKLVTVYEAPSASLSFAVKSALEEAGFAVIEQVERRPLGHSLAAKSGYRGRYSRLLTIESNAKEAKLAVIDFLNHYESRKSRLE